jgi:hypothetical protein
MFRVKIAWVDVVEKLFANPITSVQQHFHRVHKTHGGLVSHPNLSHEYFL